MQYNQFGDTGLVVSRLAFGAMTFGDQEFGGFKSNVSEAEAREMVACALDAGINFFDTADMYSAGQSEEILGRALGKRRQDVVLATKAFFPTAPAVLHAGLSRRHILDACEASLRRLGTDYVDLFLLHNYDSITPLEETARALDDLQRQGKTRYVGQCNFSAWQSEKLLATQRQLGLAPIIATQVYYSLLGRDIEREIIPQAREAGLGVMVWGPLAGGFLTGKYTRDTPAGGEGRRATFNFPPIDVEQGFEVVDKLTEIGAAHNATPAQAAIAWILSKPFVNTLLVGVSKLSQLESNLEGAKLNLSLDEVQLLDSLTQPSKTYPHWIQWGHPVAARAIKEGWAPN
ncbi:MAG: aldo/keto reductase [Leptolyngbyaceae cyanobacterium MO_188.B28]|nr:aldo/keto reductase [Leptolyngbyaceae cyanobacterium MO_188.B28]